MSAADAEHDDLRTPLDRESANAIEREEEARELNRAQLGSQFLFPVCSDISEESEREMNLLRGDPAHAGQARVQPNEQFRNRRRQFQTNEKALRLHLSGSRFVIPRNRRAAEARQPGWHTLPGTGFPTGF